ncbi:MAG: DEAD/DEAH box helicase family protein [Rhodobacteraceae bacterium]|nr:DEAD/DEAH box helicase family protein [Paracoccaceae bacterium]
MSDLLPTEKRFEEYIEGHLKSVGYSSIISSEYDRNLCLIPIKVINFIRLTQPNNWLRLQEIYNQDVENKVLTRISSEISKRGIIDVLRNQVVDRSINLNLCYFKPKSDLNPDHFNLYQSNHFTVVRQLHYSNKNENSIDMVLFLNGLPIVTMELKNQLTGQNFKDSESQYRHYRDPKEPLLEFKRCMVHFCIDNNNISMSTRLAGKKTSFLPYNKDRENPPVEKGYRTKYFWEEILLPSSILDIIENFVHVAKKKDYIFNNKTEKIEKKENELLIFPRYHQLNLIRKFRCQLIKDGVGKKYLVQHTTGSGKSYSICWLTYTLNSLYRYKGDTTPMFDTIIVVTDRKVLDNQLRNTIRSFEKIIGVVNAVEHGSKELKKFLEQGKAIVITTIQKFPFISKTIASLGDRTFAVIIDEVHSSQSGELSKELKRSLSKNKDDDAFDYEEMLRKVIQSRGRQDHISFFGFTGTPKEQTLELFGAKTPEGTFNPFDTYSMHQSIYEGFTLDVLLNYTTYERYFKVKKTIDGDIEVPKDKVKGEIIRYVDSHKLTVKNKVQVILDHWINKGSKEIKGQSRGMVVTQSRKNCVRYFNEINQQLKMRGTSYHCLVGFSGEVTVDGKKYTEQTCNQSIGQNGDVPLGLKSPKYRLLVVANKFLTGFDEPLVQSMYVDKKLRSVQCVQTLSRLNRTASGKSQTFVLDFVNKLDDIRESFQRFYKSTFLESETDPNRLYDLKRKIYDLYLFTNEDVNRFCEVFYDHNRDEGDLHPILDQVVDKYNSIDDDKLKEDYRNNIQSYNHLYGFLSQIINFSDIELEKTFIFLKYLHKKLPKRQGDRFNILNAIELDSLRIQKVHENNESLEPISAGIQPVENYPCFSSRELEYDFLTEIINQLNNTYGIILNEKDKLEFASLNKSLIEDSDTGLYLNESNSEDNKKSYFKKRLDQIMVEKYSNGKFDFYEKIDSNPQIKDLVFHELYKGYKNHRVQT